MSFSTPTRELRELRQVRRVCLVGAEVSSSAAVLEDTKRFGLPMFHSEDASEYLTKGDLDDVAFVLADFCGPVFERLHAAEATILGPTAIAELSLAPIEVSTSTSEARSQPVLYISTRPLFCTSMRGLAVCFSGYRRKETKKELKRFLFMIHSMGGRVLADVATSQKIKLTHLVVNEGKKDDKYTYASTFDIPIMTDAWIVESWQRRHERGFVANDAQFEMKFKAKPFYGARIYFLGFTDEERGHMVQELLRNGGRQCQDYKTETCTHVVVENSNVSSLPSDLPGDAFVVKAEWFWATIQMDACAEEKMYLYSDSLTTFLSPRTTYFSPGTPGSHGRRKKRRTELVKQLAQIDNVSSVIPSTSKKARSSLSELSLLDTPDKSKKPDSDESPRKRTSPSVDQPASSDTGSIVKSPRQQVFMELVQTEENYVAILDTVITLFKEPLESPKMRFLNQTEMKNIFGNIPPILHVHSKMLQDLTACLRSWKEPVCIGDVVSRHAKDLLRVYPPFVNFFEGTKKTLEECDKTNPRFHAFLKVCESKKECGRQTLAELLIRPVQRLGSIKLLLVDLLKHTKKEKDHPDSLALEIALSKIKEILTNINEDKRKTEGQVHIFEIFSDIENCPPDLVSSQRKFLTKVDVVELGGYDELCGKGSPLTLFLFSDVLEISKRRQRAGRMRGPGGLGLRSPSTLSLRDSALMNTPGTPGTFRSLKHVDLMRLSAIRRVVDIIDGNEHRDCFTIVYRTNQELKERMFVFQITSAEVQKSDFLKMLCQHVAKSMYTQDFSTYLAKMLPSELSLASSDLTVNRGYRSLNRVKKAFSFSRYSSYLE